MADAVEKESGFDLRDYLQILRRRKLLIVLAVLIAVGASLASSFLQTPAYEADAHLLLQPASSTRPLFDQQGGSTVDPVRDNATAIQVLPSTPVQDAVL